MWVLFFLSFFSFFQRGKHRSNEFSLKPKIRICRRMLDVNGGCCSLGTWQPAFLGKALSEGKTTKKENYKTGGNAKGDLTKIQGKRREENCKQYAKKIALIYDVKMSSIPKQSEKAMHSGYVTPVSLHKMALRTQRHTESKTTFTKTLFIANDLVSSIIYS